METADVLFSKKLPLIVKSPDRDKRKAHIQVCVEVHCLSNPLPKKEMVIRLTDEQDLFFLYTLHLGEDDFQSLKMQQGLLVDFSAFPQNVIDLLQSILAEEHKELPRFILELVCTGGSLGTSSSTLNIIETNSFKHLTHLALKFLPGSDSDVKKYLADCLKTLKDQNQTLYTKLQHTESELNGQLRQAREALASRTTELDNLKTEWTSRVNELSSRHVREISGEKEKTIEMQAAYQNKHEREKREMEQTHSKIVRQMESKMKEYEVGNRDLMDRKYKSEGTIRELSSKLSLTEEELNRVKLEMSNLRKNNADLDGNYHEKDKVVNQLNTRLAVLEQEVKDKDSLFAKTSDLLHTEQHQKKKLEEDIEKKQKHIRKLEISVKKLSEELTKGNEIIHRLQTDVKNYHEKLKLRSKVSTEQEKLLGEKSKEMETIRKSLAEAQSSLKMKESENEKLTESLNTTNQKLEESKQLLKTNENVISWLNKQVTESQLHSHRTAGTFEMNSTTSSNHPAFRPSMHNYSSQSYGVGGRLSTGPQPPPPGAVPTTSGPVSTVPHYYQPRSQPQVQYNPNLMKKNGVPIPIAKSSPVGTIPEESIRSSSPHQQHASPAHLTTNSRVVPANQQGSGDPVLDAKYFQKTGPFDDTPHLPKAGRTSPTPIHFSSSPNNVGFNPSRFSKENIVPQVVPKSTHTKMPLSSAYFPSNQGRVT